MADLGIGSKDRQPRRAWAVGRQLWQGATQHGQSAVIRQSVTFYSGINKQTNKLSKLTSKKCHII